MRSIAVLLVRLTVGGLLAGHGAQKLFGWFGGHGLEGTTGWLETLRLRPARLWARVGGASELAGGALTALGLLNPLGPIAGIGVMGMAWAKVHRRRAVWVTEGGPELPLTNIAVLSALTLSGPGRLSLDSLLGIRVPRRVGFLALLGVLGALWYGARPEIEEMAADLVGEAGEIELEAAPEAASSVTAAPASSAAADPAAPSTDEPASGDADLDRIAEPEPVAAFGRVDPERDAG